MVTSGYVKLIPIPIFENREKAELANISNKAINHEIDINKAIEEIDNIVFSNLGISPNIISSIRHFSQNLSTSV